MKIKSAPLVALLICACWATLFGQQNQDRVLVEGAPPLTQSMVDHLGDFFQWALEVALTPEQQKSLEKSVVESWTTKNKPEIDATLELLRVRDQLVQLAPADRDGARAQVQPEILKSLRAEPNDETAQMLLAAYDSAHSQTAPSDQPRTGGGPAGLIGNWQSGSISSINFYNPATGSWAAPSGTGMSYSLSADGQYVYAGLLQTSMYGCTKSFFAYETGSWQAQGATLTLTPKSGRGKFADTCTPSSNYDKPKPLKKQTFAFALKREESTGDQNLCLTGDTGEICYRRK